MAFLLMFGLRWASTGLLSDLPAPPQVAPRAQEAAGRVMHNIRDMVENVAGRRELPALRWPAAEPPVVERPARAVAPTAPAPHEPARTAREKRRASLLTPPEPPPPRPLESIWQILARVPVLTPPPVEPPPAPEEEPSPRPGSAAPSPAAQQER